MTPGEFLTKYKVRSFFHFTDRRNLESIRDHGGLLCLDELRRRGVVVQAPGGNEWSHEADRIKNLDKFVHLVFHERASDAVSGREGRQDPDVAVPQIDASVLHDPGVRLTADVANKSGVEVLAFAEALQVMDFKVLYEHTDWRDPVVKERLKIAKKYELLVPRQVPLDLIRGLDG